MMKVELVEKYSDYYKAAKKVIDETTCPKNLLPNFVCALNQFSKKMAENILCEFEQN